MARSNHEGKQQKEVRPPSPPAHGTPRALVCDLDAVEPNIVVVNTALSACARCGQVARAKQLLEEMEVRKLPAKSACQEGREGGREGRKEGGRERGKEGRRRNQITSFMMVFFFSISP